MDLLTTLSRLDHYRTLEAGWDSYDALPLTDAALVAARKFLLALDQRWHDGALSAIDEVSPSPDGGVLVGFVAFNQQLEVYAEPEGDFGVLHILDEAAFAHDPIHYPDDRMIEGEHFSLDDVLSLVGHLLRLAA